jgi:hypothetical protein
MRIYTLVLLFIILFNCAFAQKDTSGVTYRDTVKIVQQTDLIDIIHHIINKKDTAGKLESRLTLSFIPVIGYTLSTGLAEGISGIATFYTQKDHGLNPSIFNLQALHDAHDQNILFLQSNIWFHGDDYKLVSDIRVEKYPDVTYGLGDTTTTKRSDPITYNYFRFYQTLLRRVSGHFYVGIGYNLDLHYNIVEDIVQAVRKNKKTILTEYEIYTGVKTTTSPRTISSGYTFNFLYDTRSNPENPLQGMFFDLIFRNNYMFLGSGVDHSSVVLDVRKYMKFPKHTNNVLAIWNYNWLTLDGKPPYFDLPSTGSDMYNNTGRGYALNRFRGRHMLYLEAEYRFGITRNGLLGAVLFGNLANYSTNIVTPVAGAAADDLQKIIPAFGSGLRIKVNKHSNTNLCLDYGFGTQGSRGLFVNLGEVF